MDGSDGRWKRAGGVDEGGVGGALAAGLVASNSAQREAVASERAAITPFMDAGLASTSVIREEWNCRIVCADEMAGCRGWWGRGLAPMLVSPS